MKSDIVLIDNQLPASALAAVPPIVSAGGEAAATRFLEFFTVTIRNPNTRQAYAFAVRRFLNWCQQHGNVTLADIQPIAVAAYIEQLSSELAAPSVKQHLAAIRMLFDWLVIGHIVHVNPASSVRGPRHVVNKGKTPVLTAEQCRKLLDSIDTSTVVGLRDRALIALMTYSFARVSAAVTMDVRDFYSTGVKWMLRLHEKGGKHHEMPAHHRLAEYLDAYITAAGIKNDLRTPLFRAASKHKSLTEVRLNRQAALRMVKRRARAIGLPADICNHTFRATGITDYLRNGGELRHAKQMAAHSSERTTGLYDRTGDDVTLDEVERISI